MYKFKLASKYKVSKKHLTTDVTANNDFYTKGKIDFNDIPNSSFPDIIKGLSRKDWEKIGKKGSITKTLVTKTTVRIYKG